MSKNAKTEKKEVQIENVVDLRTALERQLEILNHKKKLADNRNLFIEKKELLESFLEEVSNESQGGDFEVPKGKIVFIIENGQSYRDQEKFSISIPEMVESYVTNLLTDIDAAIENIETQLVEEY